MRIYLLNIDYYYENIEENDYETEIYLSLERAVEEGKYFLSKRSQDKDFRDYNFTVTETDPEYAEKFNSKELNLDAFNREDFGRYEPTHIVYFYNIDGELQYKYLEYRDNQRKYRASFKEFPEDELEDVGQKFKIGDIVKVKERDEDYYRGTPYMDYWTEDKLYVVRWLPRKKDGQKYFENTYALISYYNEDEYTKGLFTAEQYERDIELYDEKIDENSPIGFLQRIIRNEIAVSDETWTKLKTGQVTLEENGTYKDLFEYSDGDTWGFYSNTLYKEDTGLPADLLISFGMFYTPIKDKIPKARVHTSDDYDEDFYISIEKKPQVIIGRCNITDDELKAISKYISDNLEVFLEYWNSKGQMDGRDLYIKLGLYKEQ